MSWALVIFIYASLTLEADSEVGHAQSSGQYHHHAHYAYEPIPGGNSYNTTVLEGDAAVLRCRLKEPGERKISWVRRRDWHILSSNLFLYINDDRFAVSHRAGSDEWNLHIEPVRVADNGTYECQVTDGEQVLSTFIHLRVKRPRAVIQGAPRQYHMVPGSTFSLRCTVVETRYPARTVSWSRDGVPLTPDPDGGLSVNTRQGEQNTTSELTLTEVSADNSGVYECRAKGAAPDQVKLFVDNAADKTAAISRRNSTAGRPGGGPLPWLLPLACLLAR